MLKFVSIPKHHLEGLQLRFLTIKLAIQRH